MSEADVQAVRDATDAWNRGDVDAMIEGASPDFEFVPAIATGVEGGSVRGPEEFRRFFSGLELDQPVFAVTWFRDGKRARIESFLEEGAAIEAASRELVK